jgi:hypothetical protein
MRRSSAQNLDGDVCMDVARAVVTVIVGFGSEGVLVSPMRFSSEALSASVANSWITELHSRFLHTSVLSVEMHGSTAFLLSLLVAGLALSVGGLTRKESARAVMSALAMTDQVSSRL